MIHIIGTTSIRAREVGISFAPAGDKSSIITTGRVLIGRTPHKIQPFWNSLDHISASRDEFALSELISNLIFDVIGATVMEADLNTKLLVRPIQGQLLRLFGDILQTYNDDKNDPSQ